MKICGLPQPLTGNELVTIAQEQNGKMAECSMPLSALAVLLSAGSPTSWGAALPTIEPTTHGVVWNNSGVVSIS